MPLPTRGSAWPDGTLVGVCTCGRPTAGRWLEGAGLFPGEELQNARRQGESEPSPPQCAWRRVIVPAATPDLMRVGRTRPRASRRRPSLSTVASFPVVHIAKPLFSFTPHPPAGMGLHLCQKYFLLGAKNGVLFELAKILSVVPDPDLDNLFVSFASGRQDTYCLDLGGTGGGGGRERSVYRTIPKGAFVPGG